MADVIAAYRPPERDTLAWVAEQFGPRAVPVHCERLVGGITAGVDRVRVRTAGGTQTEVVLRRWIDPAGWTTDLVAREAAALQALDGADVPAPRLIASDDTGRAAGVRCLLMTALPGAPLLAPTDPAAWSAQLAQTQARIHRIPAGPGPATDDRFEPAADYRWITDVGLRRAALAAASSTVSSAASSAASSQHPSDVVFAHGDYQHFNVLWQDERLCGVVDWPHAGVGSRGVDVGHCRLNLAVLFSADSAERYRLDYERASGVRIDPAADLRALMGWDEGWPRFIPLQIAGRAVAGRAVAGQAALDVGSMRERVIGTIRRALAGFG